MPDYIRTKHQIRGEVFEVFVGPHWTDKPWKLGCTIERKGNKDHDRFMIVQRHIDYTDGSIDVEILSYEQELVKPGTKEHYTLFSDGPRFSYYESKLEDLSTKGLAIYQIGIQEIDKYYAERKLEWDKDAASKLRQMMNRRLKEIPRLCEEANGYLEGYLEILDNLNYLYPLLKRKEVFEFDDVMYKQIKQSCRTMLETIVEKDDLRNKSVREVLEFLESDPEETDSDV